LEFDDLFADAEDARIEVQDLIISGRLADLATICRIPSGMATHWKHKFENLWSERVSEEVEVARGRHIRVLEMAMRELIKIGQRGETARDRLNAWSGVRQTIESMGKFDGTFAPVRSESTNRNFSVEVRLQKVQHQLSEALRNATTHEERKLISDLQLAIIDSDIAESTGQDRALPDMAEPGP